MANEHQKQPPHDYHRIPPFIDEEKVLLQSYEYIVSVPGKNFRKKLTEAFNYWLEVDANLCDRIADIVSLLHNASLLVDDIEDNSSLRRGVPTAHRVFGIPSTLNTANYVYFLGLEKCLELGSPKAVQVFSEQLLELHRGQGMEIYYRDNLICPTVEDYELMVKRKTGGLFGLAVKMMQVFSRSAKATENYSTLVALFGLYFQIRDDYENLVSDDYAKNKTFCEDLTEGKFSYPIIHAIRKDPADVRILNILRQRTQDEDLKKYAVSVLHSLGSLKHTHARLQELDALCREETERLGGNKHLTCILDELKVRCYMPPTSTSCHDD